MNINKIDNTNFEAGNVFLKRINSEKSIKCYDSIKKLAEDKNIDIFITRNKESKYLPKEDMYVVIAKKEIPIVTRMFFPIGTMPKHGIGCTILSKNASKEELSEKIYSAAIKAIEVLEEKISNKHEIL